MNDLVRKIMEAFGIDVEQATAELKDYEARYPNEADRIAAVEEYIRTHATAEAIASIPATVAGIAKDVGTGRTGVDPQAWASGG